MDTLPDKGVRDETSGTWADRRSLCADADISPELIADLRAKGWNIKSSIDTIRAHAPDEQVRKWARQEKRILLTEDVGFWNDRKHPLQDTAGIVILENVQGTEQSRMLGVLFTTGFIANMHAREWLNAKAKASPHIVEFKRLGGFKKRLEVHDDKLYEIE